MLEYFSLGWMSIEVIVSVVAGLIVGKSLALLAFGGDSVIELISAYAVLSYLRKLGKGSFGVQVESERVEKVVTLLLILLIPVIASASIYSYYSGIKLEASPLGVALTIGAVVIMSILWIQKKTIGRRGNIQSLTIDATESATCLFMALSALGGLLVNYLFHITWADYLATAVILGFVVLEIRESLEEMEARA